MTYRAPKGILDHPAVEFCEDAQALGFEEDMRHDVGLYPGWVFDYQDQDRTNMRFANVNHFLSLAIIPDPKDAGNTENILQSLIAAANVGGKSNITEGMKMALAVLLQSPRAALLSAEVQQLAISMVHKDAEGEIVRNAAKASGGLPSLKKRGVIFSRKMAEPGLAVMVPGKFAKDFRSGMVPVQAYKNRWFLKGRSDEARKFLREQKRLAIEQWPEALKALRAKEAENAK